MRRGARVRVLPRDVQRAEHRVPRRGARRGRAVLLARRALSRAGLRLGGAARAVDDAVLGARQAQEPAPEAERGANVVLQQCAQHPVFAAEFCLYFESADIGK